MKMDTLNEQVHVAPPVAAPSPLVLRPATTERRNVRRRSLRQRIGMALVKGRPNFLLRRAQFDATLTDATLRGMRVRLDRALPKGAAIKIWVDVYLTTEPTPVQLRGTVRWCRPTTPVGDFLVGISLNDEPEIAMQVWTRSMLNVMRPVYA